MRQYDWDRVSEHYRRHRPGPPQSYYNFLWSLDLGLPGQHVLDIGTGPGLLACQFAHQGAKVIGIDISEGQIEQARLLARSKGLDVLFKITPAENLSQLDHSIDLAVANMCWGYLDQPKVLNRLVPQLANPGNLVISSCRWRGSGPAGELSLKLLGEYGIRIQHAGSTPDQVPRIDDPRLQLRASIYYEEPITFERNSWIRRLLASKQFSALSEHQYEVLSKRMHDHFTRHIDEQFDIDHGISLQIYRHASLDTAS